MRILSGIVLAALTLVPAAAEDFKQPVEQIIAEYIRPASDQFKLSAGKLPEAVKAVCAQQSEVSRANFLSVNSQVIRDFAGIYFLRLGPVIEDDRLSRLAFMPDPRGLGARQIRKVIAAKDETVLSASSLAEKSVALQGLTALQMIAFDKNAEFVLGGSSEASEFTCNYAFAIAENVSRMASEIAAGWYDPDGFSKTLLSTGASNKLYRNDKEAMEAVFNALATGLTVARDQNLLPAIGKSEEKAKPRRIPFSRSGNGILFLSSELEAIEAALGSMNLRPKVAAEHEWLFDTVRFEFKNAQKALSELTPPIRQTLDSASYSKLAVLSITLQSAKELVAPEIAGALGLAGGFNALDGD